VIRIELRSLDEVAHLISMPEPEAAA